MVVHVFNSGIVSGPETLVFPALTQFREPQALVLLVEKRLGDKGRAPLEYARGLGLRVEAVEVESRFDLSAVGRLRGVLRWLQPKVVHAHDVKATAYAWLASRGEPWKKISTHHGVLSRPDWKTKLYERIYSSIVLPRMDMAIAVSREDEFVLLRRGLNPQHLAFVPNGITRKRWWGEERKAERNRLREKWRSEFGIDGDEVLVGIVARLSPEKRHQYLLRILAAMRRERADLRWKLFVVGTGPLEAALKADAAALGIAEHVLWLGYRGDAHAMMPGLDLLALPSAAEGLPIVALEAGWAALPVFASNVGGLPELIRTGREAGGVLFPREQEHGHTAKSLAWLMEHPRERERMGERLQARVESEYSGARWVKQMETVYRGV
jgi:glycosyltransferase involved in cell wall biosynthesis